jgi:hypothetical protein
VRASTRHYERKIERLRDQARAAVAPPDPPADPPGSDSGEPTAESLGLVARRSTQVHTPNEPNGDRPTWYKAVRTAPATLSAPTRTPRSLYGFQTFCMGSADLRPARVRAAWGKRLGRVIHPAGARRAGECRRPAARRDLQCFGDMHSSRAGAGVGLRWCRTQTVPSCTYTARLRAAAPTSSPSSPLSFDRGRSSVASVAAVQHARVVPRRCAGSGRWALLDGARTGRRRGLVAPCPGVAPLTQAA